MKTDLENFEEVKRQMDQLESAIEHYKETRPTQICLRGEGVKDVNSVWVESMNLDLINLKEFVDQTRERLIEHLEKERVKLTKLYEIRLSRNMFRKIIPPSD